MNMFFHSVQWKLIVIYTMITLVAMQIIGLYFVQANEEYYLDNFNRTLETQASLLSVNLERYLSQDEINKEEINLLANSLFALNGVDVTITDQSGLVISTSDHKE